MLCKYTQFFLSQSMGGMEDILWLAQSYTCDQRKMVHVDPQWGQSVILSTTLMKTWLTAGKAAFFSKCIILTIYFWLWLYSYVIPSFWCRKSIGRFITYLSTRLFSMYFCNIVMSPDIHMKGHHICLQGGKLPADKDRPVFFLLTNK